MAISPESFIGTVVRGRLQNTGQAFAFDVDRVLGTAFVLDPVNGVILTCDHVLPSDDRNSGKLFAFYTMTGDLAFRPFLIDCSSAVQWEHHGKCRDLIALKVQNPSGLRSYLIDSNPINLADQVVTIGLPLNHYLSSTPTNFVITPRAIVSHVVSGYELECETDKPFITTMSGSPVFRGSTIVGICYLNREYAINQYLTERTDTCLDDAVIRTERYEYSEVSRFGVFYRASAWSSWASSLVQSSQC